MPDKEQQFASDNYSGICPEAFEFLKKANRGHVYAYGDDAWTAKAADCLREFFETDCEVFFVFNGTAANSLALASLCQSYHSIICPETAHVETDECGGPEFFSNGSKILLSPSRLGKLSPAGIEKIVKKRTDIHYPKPKVVSVTQATEVGTVYSRQELLDIWATARKHALKIHMDGARFANAVASLKVRPREISWECGVDVLCLGGTKNGLAVGEAVVFFKKELAEDFAYRCKQAGQLASKMRFITAPWVGLLAKEVWLKNARNANACARKIAEQIKDLPGVRIMFPVEANAVFVELPPPAAKFLEKRGWHFYSFIGVGGIRLMCSWDTTAESVRELVKDIRTALARPVEAW